MTLRWMDDADLARHGRLFEAQAPDGLRLFVHQRLHAYFSSHPVRLTLARLGPLRWIALDDEVAVLPVLALERKTNPVAH